MIRILTTDKPAAITITVDGRLVGDYVATVEDFIGRAIAQQKPVHLFLRDVSQIDEDGRKLLSRLAINGVRLSASGVYSSYVVEEIQGCAPPKSPVVSP
jgi:hypothetical protein